MPVTLWCGLELNQVADFPANYTMELSKDGVKDFQHLYPESSCSYINTLWRMHSDIEMLCRRVVYSGCVFL